MTNDVKMPDELWVWEHPEDGNLYADTHGKGGILPATKYTRAPLAQDPACLVETLNRIIRYCQSRTVGIDYLNVVNDAEQALQRWREMKGGVDK